MAITSQIRPRPAFGEFTVVEWKKAGLGQLQPPDIRSLRASLGQILG